MRCQRKTTTNTWKLDANLLCIFIQMKKQALKIVYNACFYIILTYLSVFLIAQFFSELAQV